MMKINLRHDIGDKGKEWRSDEQHVTKYVIMYKVNDEYIVLSIWNTRVGHKWFHVIIKPIAERLCG